MKHATIDKCDECGDMAVIVREMGNAKRLCGICRRERALARRSKRGRPCGRPKKLRREPYQPERCGFMGVERVPDAAIAFCEARNARILGNAARTEPEARESVAAPEGTQG